MGWLLCSGHEHNELSGGRGSLWRLSGVERCGDFIGAGDGTNDPHRAVAALANREVDAEDAGEQTHPRQPMPRGIEQVLLERGAGVGGKLEVSLGDKKGELLGLGVHGVRGRDDSSAQGVPRREEAVVPNGVGTWRRDQGTQPGQETLRTHLGIGGSVSVGLLEVDADLSVGGARRGTEGERRPQEVAADAFESLSVAGVNRDRCVQLHAEGRDEHRFYGTGLGARR